MKTRNVRDTAETPGNSTVKPVRSLLKYSYHYGTEWILGEFATPVLLVPTHDYNSSQVHRPLPSPPQKMVSQVVAPHRRKKTILKSFDKPAIRRQRRHIALRPLRIKQGLCFVSSVRVIKYAHSHVTPELSFSFIS